MKVLILLTLFLSSCTQVTQPPKLEPAKLPAKPEPTQLHAVVLKETAEPIFASTINKRANIAKLLRLRAALPKPKRDLELRIWNGFGLRALEGFVLRRSSGNWSAIHLRGIHPKLPKEEYEKQLAAPKSGWEECWSRLVELGILTLPDASEIHCSTMMEDGMSYVVEINYENTYRTYMYDNPSYAKCEQAQKMIKIGNLIAEEFDLPEMRTRE